MIVSTFMIAAMVQASVAAGPRKEFVACLNNAVSSAKTQKVSADGFSAHAHQSCATIEASFKKGLIDFGVKNGMSKKTADEDAQLQIEDYVFTAEERYRFALEDGGGS